MCSGLVIDDVEYQFVIQGVGGFRSHDFFVCEGGR